MCLSTDGYAVVINFVRRVIVHRFNFKSPVLDVRFSPDGQYLAVAIGRKVQLWRTPSLERSFSPFVLLRTYTGHFDDVTSVDWYGLLARQP
jgi:periodic tryptophan protein 2